MRRRSRTTATTTTVAPVSSTAMRFRSSGSARFSKLGSVQVPFQRRWWLPLVVRVSARS
ncbi:hypothetical protein Hanom_Chr02g00140701 [Helianthus anomalus]